MLKFIAAVLLTLFVGTILTFILAGIDMLVSVPAWDYYSVVILIIAGYTSYKGLYS